MNAQGDDYWVDTTAVVLCGGLGTRLLPVVSDRPKGLADVGGRPFLSLLLDQIEHAGLAKAVLCTGHMADKIRSACGDRHGGMAIDYSVEESPLGTAGAVRQALAGVSTRHILVLNGDSYCHVDLRALCAAYRAKGQLPMIVLVNVPDASRFGRVECGSEGTVHCFKEKSAGMGPGLINAGIYLFPVALAAGIPGGRAVSLEKEIFPTWVISGLHGYRCDGPFIDIGTPESYVSAQGFFKKPLALGSRNADE